MQKLKLLQTMVIKDMVNKENMKDLFKVLTNTNENVSNFLGY